MLQHWEVWPFNAFQTFAHDIINDLRMPNRRSRRHDNRPRRLCFTAPAAVQSHWL